MYKLGILTEPSGWEKHYVKACQEMNVPFEVIDIVSDQWWENLQKVKVDGYLVRAAGDNETRKQMYNEKLWFVEQYLGLPMYPSYFGNLLYENKRMQIYWMKVNKIVHPETHVFYHKEEALEFIRSNNRWPLVSKPNLGGAGEGVRFIYNQRKANIMVRKVFTRWKFFNTGLTRWKRWRKIRIPVMDDKQFNYLLFQEFILAKCEWRIIKVGNTYFGHQKLASGGLHSGSGLVEHVDPPKELFELVRHISNLSGIRALNVDILEEVNGTYYVNEIQTYWGGRKPYQMKIGGESCRFIDKDGQWELEYGLFHHNRGCNLRVEDFLNQLQLLHKTS